MSINQCFFGFTKLKVQYIQNKKALLLINREKWILKKTVHKYIPFTCSEVGEYGLGAKANKTHEV